MVTSASVRGSSTLSTAIVSSHRYLRLFRISLSRIDRGFCLILDDLEKNYYEAGKNNELANRAESGD